MDACMAIVYLKGYGQGVSKPFYPLYKMEDIWDEGGNLYASSTL